MIKFKFRQRILGDGVTLTEFAKELGIHNSHLSRLVSQGQKTVDVSLIDFLCKRLNCTVADLIEYVPDEGE